MAMTWRLGHVRPGWVARAHQLYRHLRKLETDGLILSVWSAPRRGARPASMTSPLSGAKHCRVGVRVSASSSKLGTRFSHATVGLPHPPRMVGADAASSYDDDNSASTWTAHGPNGAQQPALPRMAMLRETSPQADPRMAVLTPPSVAEPRSPC